ncbi:HAMP domain-containing sensor histidine kinase [Lentibacillus sp. CBA3610]|uniref:sensor histidine kinase n=1 Tax=Lentibacillus sp. CBA3610 TaxID=2518176 RepID=UPI001595DEEF|nr:HAMP domain-containing sensor histidine kinase [Lentibacillus sp. CBA3610]QKY70737.1 HAMP domain-containing histidine kinase [Lentibacillus sp. CBA3610]
MRIFKFFRSLQAKYLLIIIVAIFVMQISLIISALILTNADVGELERDYSGVEDKWHRDAGDIQDASRETVMAHFREWKQAYPDAGMFWVNDDGRLSAELDTAADLLAEWDAAYTAQFIKDRYNGNPFTVVAFLGQEENQGFIVLELPRAVMDNATSDRTWVYSVTFLVLILLFMIVSLIFFRQIRKRLLNLQKAMAVRDVDNLPVLIDVKKDDEIGQLETAFNNMVNELRESREREQEEEQLRRELVANLSHDLRTPLTKMRAQMDAITREGLSDEGGQAFERLEESIDHVDRLMENLMSYTLLTASKLKYQPEETDVIRHVRTSLASWYPLFEQENFEINVNLESFDNNDWLVDPLWMDRILDNLLQNIMRYAKEGRYVGVATETTHDYDAILITDHGPGMDNEGSEKGAGIGLSIVDMMVRQMGLDWDIDSDESGTAVRIKKQTID